jgi:uncharacterized membrane protein
MKSIHIVAGLLSLLAGAVALYAAKGSPLHRRSGLLFAAAMLTMTTSALLMAALFRPNMVNVIAATLTFYLVCTGLMTVKLPVERTRAITAGLMLVALAVGAGSLALGLDAVGRGARIDGIPAPPVFMFSVVALIAAAGDARLLRAGGIAGGPRLARHLWRMGYAMWIATMSFFLGQAKFFPAPIRRSGLLVVPVLLVLAVMVYWLWRVRRRGLSALPEKARGDAAQPRAPRHAPYSSTESMPT